MEEKKKEKKHLIILAIAFAQLVFAVGFMIYGAFTHVITGSQGDIAVVASLFIFWALMDVVEPLAIGRFQDITERQKSAYLKYIVFDLVGFAGIAYFLFSMNGSGGNGILGAMIYVVSIRLKRNYQDIFYGYVTEDEQEEEAADEQETGAPDGGQENEPEDEIAEEAADAPDGGQENGRADEIAEEAADVPDGGQENSRAE